jgi:hypothetical protein
MSHLTYTVGSKKVSLIATIVTSTFDKGPKKARRNSRDIKKAEEKGNRRSRERNKAEIKEIGNMKERKRGRREHVRAEIRRERES